jgi:tetratricopeptide (TPR) repeat protein
MRALAKEPDERFANATEFAEALDQSLPSDTTEVITRPALPAAMPPRAAKTVMTRQFRAALLPRGFAVAVPIAAVVAFGATMLVQQLGARGHEEAAPAAAAAAQPAGSAIAIVAPRETAPPAPAVAMTQASAAPPVIIERRPPPVMPLVSIKPAASVTPAVSTPVVATAPPTQTTSTAPRDVREADRRRKEAIALSNTHAWRQAIDAWSAFIRDYSGISAAADHAAYYNLGVAHEALRHWSEAAEAFENANRVDGSSGDTSNFIRLGRCYGKIGQWPNAASAYERALRIDPDNQVARTSLLFALQQQPRGH